MCSRFSAFNIHDAFIKSIISEDNLISYEKSTVFKTSDFYPNQVAPIILSLDNQLVLMPMVWGYPGYINKDKPNVKPRPLINAKSETIDKLHTWKDSVQHRRCIIPTSGFYEWMHLSNKEKIQYKFNDVKQENTYLAGIYKTFSDEKISRFSIVTTQANESMKDVHDRMPLVILESEIDTWLNDDYQSLYNRSEILLNRQPLIKT